MKRQGYLMTELRDIMEDNKMPDKVQTALFGNKLNQVQFDNLLIKAMKDNNLSYTSKGILLDLIGFNQNGADSTKFDPTVLYAINNSELDDKDLIRSALSELEKGGYLTPLSSR